MENLQSFIIVAIIFKGRRGRYNSVYYVENLIRELCRENITSRSSLYLDANGRPLEIKGICGTLYWPIFYMFLCWIMLEVHLV